MTARIEAAKPPYPPEIQDWLSKVMPPGVPPLRLFTTLARDPRLFGKFFSGGLLDRGHLTLRQRELVIARTTALCRSEYEWGVHIALFAQKVGFDSTQIRALVYGTPEDACWSDSDTRLLAMCDALHHTSTLTEEQWNSLRSDFSEEAIIELLLLAGFYRTVSYLTNAFNLPSEIYSASFPT
ncbi:MAG: carboxymuconolactone decarboxylase family protein [Sterolibacterium sp.]